MSVIIHGLNMPKGDNAISITIFSNGKVSLAHDEKYAEYAEAVPLPEGHGRLIDADAVVKTICNSCDGACDVVQCDCLNCKADCRCDIAKEISDAPTIIEADLEWKMKNCCCFSNTDQAEGGGEECSEN